MKDAGSIGTPRIEIRKWARRLSFADREYKIILGFAPTGSKQVEGDGKTPEGEYYIAVKNEKSSYYLSLGISYPGIEDAGRGLATGLITREEHDEIVTAIQIGKMPPQKTALGGEIYIHGGGTHRDWTRGCIALDDADMKELFDAAMVGTRVTILA